MASIEVVSSLSAVGRTGPVLRVFVSGNPAQLGISLAGVVDDRSQQLHLRRQYSDQFSGQCMG